MVNPTSHSAQAEPRGRRSDLRIAGLGAIATLLAAVIAVASALVTSSVQNGQETTLQLRVLKQTQYAQASQALQIENQSIQAVLDDLKRGSTESALSEVTSYRGADDVVRAMASLPLVADLKTEIAATKLIDTRSRVDIDMNAFAVTISQGGKPETAGLLRMNADNTTYKSAQSDLTVAMRNDLGIPED